MGGENVTQEDFSGPARGLRAILLVSVLGLFLEMLLIRWIGTEVRIFAYLQNTVLVVCFLGLGLGLFTSRQPYTLRQMLIPLALLVLLLAVPLSRQVLGYASELLSVLGDPVIWGELGGANLPKTLLYVTSGLAITAFVLALVLDMFVPLGRFLGRLMDDHPRIIAAYSANVAGSLLGIWLFVLVSSFYQPPVTWIAVVAVLTFVLMGRTERRQWLNLALLVGVIVLAWFAGRVPGSVQVVWSPYQKLVTEKLPPVEGRASEYLITVNNTGFQVMSDFSHLGSDSHPGDATSQSGGLTQYDLPLRLHPNAKKYLIVGAGAGNDAAGGLRQKAEEIVAVEIDPAIIELGRLYHPEQPYSSPAVTVVSDDARSFFATSDERFDVIAFGLLDAHTTTSLTNSRLDHYVYTRESIERARSLLAPGGIMTMTFLPQRFYIADRLAAVMREVFDEEPISFAVPVEGEGWGYIMFVAGDLASARARMASDQQLAAYLDWSTRTLPVPSFPYSTRVATDDWPYIYLERPKIPVLYFLLAGLMVGIMVWSTRRWRVPGLRARWGQSHWHFFFLGAAFLLLEVQNISKASVVLGNTWQVNAVIVSGVLSMALLANLIVHKVPRLPLGPVYVALLGTCLGLYFVDLARFAFLPYAAKALIVGALTTMPALFSGIVFIRSFAIVPRKDLALGANMIGSMVGALLQSVTFLAGIKALLLLVAGLYALSLVTRPRTAEQEQPAPAVLDTPA
jgi:spermidine synthase